ncbi:unnamed protein product, partial [Dovyalis caffra]
CNPKAKAKHGDNSIDERFVCSITRVSSDFRECRRSLINREEKPNVEISGYRQDQHFWFAQHALSQKKIMHPSKSAEITLQSRSTRGSQYHLPKLISCTFKRIQH